ncbi:MAG: beta-ketoacyl synthase N-terminal-like domain-containing protein, partial [Rhodospirillaceae bacterium]
MSQGADTRQAAETPIAVVGIGALFPGSGNAAGFWRDICRGRDLVTDVPPTHWLAEDYFDPDPAAVDKTYCKRGAFLAPTPFSPVEFGIPPAALPATDTSQLLALIVAQQALGDAFAGREARIPRERTCVILGATSGQELLVQASSRLQKPVWLKALREAGIAEDKAQSICDSIAGSYVPWQENTFPGLLGNVIAGRIANRFDFGGTNCVTDAACASSFSALAMAADELRLGRADLALAGGVDTFNDISMYVCFSKTPALSATGDCRPFSADADGTVLGEGLALFALKRLADAEADGDSIYAVLRGIGTSSDGRAKSIYAPLPEGQARALSRAYRAAGYAPDTVELVEAHGTATRAGDAAEIAGLEAVFAQAADGRRRWCALGSVKSQIGHTKAAAGAAGLFKAVMALHHKVLPPTIKVAAPNAALERDDSPFYLNVRARPWVRTADHPRRASVSSFGFGGSNFHVTVEEYAGPAPRPGRIRTGASELVVLSQPDGAALARAARALAGDADGADDFARVAAESRAAFDAALPARLAVVAKDAADLAARLAQAAARIDAGATSFELPGVYCGSGAAAGAVAFLFPGQGSQRVDMGADLAMAFDDARAVWDRASDAVRGDDLRLHEVVFPVPAFTEAARAAQAARLTRTEWAQPAIGAASLATLAVLRAAGISASCFGGHSFGELTALAAAGALDETGLLTLARRRGEAMAAAARVPGTMSAVLHDIAAVEARVADWALDVTLANRNSPRQGVLSGSPAAIEEAERRLAAEGIRTQRLAVATAFHSPIVAGAAAAFRDALGDAAIVAPPLPVFSNIDGAPHPPDTDAIRDRLAGQIAAPVRFADMIRAMYAAGARIFVEVGPGVALTRFVEDCLGDDAVAVATDRKSEDGLAALWHALGRLAAAGVAMRLSGLEAGTASPAAPAGAKAAFTVPIAGANYGKIYPPAGGAAALPPPVRVRPAPAEAMAVATPEPPLPPPPAPVPAFAPLPLPAPARDTSVELGMFQRALSDAQSAYQSAVADSHTQFLRTMEAAFAAWTGGRAAAPAPGVDVFAPMPDAAPAVMAPPSWPQPAPPSVPTPEVAPPAPEAPPPAHAAGIAVGDILIAVVAEKTGYPPEMLKLEMALEADLGIDSIKRVEILSALQDRL